LKKTGVLNKKLSKVIAGMGHADMLVVSDAGLPVPKKTKCVDLAVTKNVPGLLETAQVISQELKVEKIILAEETEHVCPHIQTSLQEIFKDAEVEIVTINKLKDLCVDAAAVVRTGEFTPYANVILVSGVVFPE
jgi:D-ribose pyranase